MGKCIVGHCINRSGHVGKERPKISFFRFPKDVNMKRRWVKAIKKQDWIPSKFSSICSNHFEEKFLTFYNNGVRKLAKNAVPTLDLPEITCSTKGTQTDDINSSNVDVSTNFNFFYEHEQSNSSDSFTSPVSRPTTPQSSYFDLSSTSSMSTFNISDNEKYEEDYINISSDDTPRKKKLKYEVRRLFFISKKRKEIISRLQQNNRRLKKKINSLKSILDKLREEKLVNNDEITFNVF
ncbi:THAP domain-containing protein 1-like [Anoplophora glabripennis]|uniref:THAP domain-containing protein 1-like n=1 Tax=Anoplophora glabripennis TaxID=217634 RepID=UPI000874A61B|nr:THAP domain-containing protein 1-like [Anoplophora glabripennis]